MYYFIRRSDLIVALLVLLLGEKNGNTRNGNTSTQQQAHQLQRLQGTKTNTQNGCGFIQARPGTKSNTWTSKPSGFALPLQKPTCRLDGGENNMQQRREYRALHQLFQNNQTTHKHSITAQTNSQRHALEQDSPPSPDNTDPSTARDAHPYSTCCCIEYVRRKHTNAALLDAAAISKVEAFRNKQQTMLVLLLRSCRRNQALPEDNNQGKNNFNEPSRPKITAPANGGGTAVQPHPHWLRHQPRAPWVLGGGTK